MKKILFIAILSACTLPVLVFAQGWNIEMLDTKFTAWHAAELIACQGDYVYLSLDWSSTNGGGIAIVDVSDVENPVEMGYFEGEDNVDALEVVGDYVYIGYSYMGLSVLNVSNPTDPVEIFNSDIPDDIQDICIDGDYAYLASLEGEFTIADISNPENVRFISQMNFTGFNRSVVVSGNYAYLGRDDELCIINVSDPLNPVLVNRMNPGGDSYALAISGNYLYTALWWAGVHSLDISDPVNPQLVGYAFGNAYDLVVAGNTAYVVGGYQTLKILDISDPSHLTTLSLFDTASDMNEIVFGGDHIFAAYDTDGLEIIDVSNPTNPFEVVSYEPNYEIRDVALVGNYAMIANQENGLMVVDVSNPANMLYAANLSGFSAYSIMICGEYAYMRSSDVTQVLAINEPTNPRVEGEVDFDGAICCVDEVNHRLYVASENADLAIFDNTSATNPYILGTYWLQGGAYDDAWFNDIAVEGNLLYAVATYWEWGEGGCLGDSLLILDITDPTNLVFVSMNNLGGSSTQIEVRDNLAYIGAEDPMLRIIDISDPIRPGLISSLEYPGFAQKMILDGDYVYLLSSYNVNLRIINISDPDNPELTGYYTTPDDPYNFVVGDEIIFVADDEYFESYDVDDAVWVKPVTQTEHPMEFAILTAYPNPFNASTTISFELRDASFVNLTIYDITGREVARLVDGMMPAGSHQVVFDAKDLTSGVYFARLTAGDFRGARKMLLLK